MTDIEQTENAPNGQKPAAYPCRVEPLVSQPLPLNSIICGDNCDVLGTFPRECIDLVVTSPPYDDLRTYGGHSWDFEGVAQQLWRVIKPGGVVVWVVADATIDGSETGTSFRQALRFMEIGFRLHDTMIYKRIGSCSNSSHKNYLSSWEFMFVFSSGEPKHVNILRDRKNVHSETTGKYSTSTSRSNVDGSRDMSPRTPASEFGKRMNVWEYSPIEIRWSAIRYGIRHPAPFPESLARDHILSWSNEGDIVLDPFNGSGTTTKMARLMGRRFIGIDVNESYCEIARKRLAQKLLEFGDAG